MAKDGPEWREWDATTVRIVGDRICWVQLGHLTRHPARRERILFSEDVDSRTSCKSVGTHARTGSRSFSFPLFSPPPPPSLITRLNLSTFIRFSAFFLLTFHSLSTFWHPLTGPQLPLPRRPHPFTKRTHQSFWPEEADRRGNLNDQKSAESCRNETANEMKGFGRGRADTFQTSLFLYIY